MFEVWDMGSDLCDNDTTFSFLNLKPWSQKNNENGIFFFLLIIIFSSKKVVQGDTLNVIMASFLSGWKFPPAAARRQINSVQLMEALLFNKMKA